MCGRYTITVGAADLERRFDLDRVPERATRRYNVAPGQQVLAVVADSHGRHAELLRWGLIPAGSTDPKIGYRMINARSETVREKRSFRDLIATSQRRALIVADGFYEWLAPERPKAPRVPMRFTLAAGQPFALAGLWTSWDSPEGETVETCTILTTAPNEVVAPIHVRMPAILSDQAAEAAWLDPRVDADGAVELLRPLPAFLMRAAPASTQVNSARNDWPELLDSGQLDLEAA